MWSYLRCVGKLCNTCHSNRPPSPHLAGDQETTSETILLLPAHVKVLTKRSTDNGVCPTDSGWKIKQVFKNKTPEDYFSLNLLSIYQVGPTGQMMTTSILYKASLRDITKTIMAMVDSALRRQETKIVINSTPHQISATSNHAVHFTVS